MKTSKLTVSIVLPNWNGAALLVKNLPKVIAAAGNSEIIVVDDCSTDDSVTMLKSQFPKIRTVVKTYNSGFAETVNIGIAKAHGDIVILLNTDVVPEKGFLRPLLAHFSDPAVFAVGCLEKNPEESGIVLRGRGVAHWQKGFYIHARGEVNKDDTAWVAGGSGAFRKSLLVKLGALDSIYSPFYWEDIDLSYRALKAGYTLVFEPKSQVWHYHKEGAIKTQFEKNRVNRIVFRNQFIFIWKNLTDPGLWMAHLCWAPIRIIQELVRGDSTMFFGFVLALGKIPQILMRRKEVIPLWRKRDSDIAVY